MSVVDTEIPPYTASTTDPAGGNPAGVVLDATGLTPAQTLSTAAEVGYSETAFLLPHDDGGDGRCSSPPAEVSSCGHTTTATAVAHAERHGPGRLLLATRAGPVEVLATPATAGRDPARGRRSSGGGTRRRPARGGPPGPPRHVRRRSPTGPDRRRQMSTLELPRTSDVAFTADVLSSPLPVLVDFTADWCPPCRMVAPVLRQIADEEAGRMHVVALDVDADPRTARAYGVMGMPTLGLFVRGELVASVVGARPRSQIMRVLEPHLAAAVGR